MGLSARADDATLVLATRAGDHDAFETLVQRWLPRALDLALFVLADADDAAAAAADGFEQLWRRRDDIEPPAAFGAMVIRATRRAALGRLEAGAAPRDHLERAPALVTRDGTTAEERLVERPKADDAMAHPDLAEVVRSAGVAVDPAERSLLLAHVRDDIEVAGLAEDMGRSTDETDQLVFRVRARYRAALEARVLWRGGHPRCADLASILDGNASARFDADVATQIIDHAESCTACKAAKRLQATPAALLAAMPVADVPERAQHVVRDRLGGVGLVISPAAAHGLQRGRGRADGGGDGDEPKRRRPAAILAAVGVAAAVLAVVLLAVQPWSSPPKRAVGVLGGASDGSTARGSIQASSSSTTAAPTTTTTTTVRRTTTTHAPKPPTSSTTSPPATIVTPPGSDVVRPVITSASAARSGDCPDSGGMLIHVTWQTTGATAVSVTPTPLVPGPFPGSGEADLCAAKLPATITLSAVGPGGETIQSLVVGGGGGTTTTTTIPPTPSTAGLVQDKTAG